MKYASSIAVRRPRLLLAFGLLLAAFLAWTATDRAAQNPDKPPPKRVEDEDKPPKQRMEEEEDPAAVTPPKRKIRFEEEDPNAKPSRPGINPSGDLKQLAREAKTADVKALYSKLAVPFDRVTKMSGEKIFPPIRVVPLETYYGGKGSTQNGPAQFTRLDDENKSGKPEALERSFFYKSIKPYELVALEELDKYRKDHKADYEELLVEEQVLSAVLRFHGSAKERGERKGDWSEVENQLRQRLMSVLLDQLRELTAAADYETAFTLATRLADSFPGESDQQVIGPRVLDLLETALKAKEGPNLNPNQLRDVHQRLRALAVQFPNNPKMQELKDRLKKRAEELFSEAETLGQSSNPKELEVAEEKLRQAEELWPTLPGIEERHLKIRQKRPILKVGVRQLPKYLSPHTARTDTELRAVEMLFESLVKFSPDESGVGRYHTALAEGRPQIVELGRQFQLPANAYWCNPEKVGDGTSKAPPPDPKDALTFNDVRATFHALQKGDGPDHSLAWENLYGEKVVTGGGSGLRATVNLSKGYIEPLALMNAKIVPAWALQKTEQFGLNPIGSGPFVYAGIDSDQGRTYAKFLANPYYGIRAGKRELPQFREVRFYLYTNAEKEVSNKNAAPEILLDLTADEADAIQQAPNSEYKVHWPTANTRNRRVYYLAINHRLPPLNDENARSALSMAINREKLLDDYFRGKLKQKVHKAINCLYPANCWASDPRLRSRKDPNSCDPYDPELAKPNWELAKKKLRQREVSLTLKYPDGDPALGNAMTALAAQVQEVLQIQIRPEPVDVRTLQRDLETSNFELAYCHYDFPDDTFWLGPLFAPKKPAENTANLENIFGYESAELTTQLQKSIDYRDFSKVQEHTRLIHKILTRETPVIPLWQLDALHAFRKDVQTTPFDPQRVFTDIEKWHLGKRSQ